jgi:hypothetical protein
MVEVFTVAPPEPLAPEKIVHANTDEAEMAVTARTTAVAFRSRPPQTAR